MTDIQKRLFELSDEKYREFQAPLMPTVDKSEIIGVRTPVLRSLAKELYKSGNYAEFIACLPHRYYEEYNLHAFILCEYKDFDECLAEVDRLLPFINNWATCDCMTPKCFKKNVHRLPDCIRLWIKRRDVYSVRFGIKTLMNFYLDEHFDPAYLETVANIRSDEYYIKMMQAWYFATALAKQYDSTIPYIEKRLLDDWVHSKTIQKARESYRITDEQKEYLKSLR